MRLAALIELDVALGGIGIKGSPVARQRGLSGPMVNHSPQVTELSIKHSRGHDSD
jgi:hypothetical protein